MIQKHSYLPKYIPNDSIQKHVEDKSVWEVEVINDIQDVHEVNIFSIEEPNYVMMIM